MIQLKVFQNRFHPVNFWVSGKAVTVIPNIDPNGFHSGIECPCDIRVRIVSNKDTILIRNPQLPGGIVKDTPIRFMDTYFTGKNNDIK